MSAASNRMLTSTGERRIIPTFKIPGGIVTVTGFKRGRGGMRVLYRYDGQKEESWMLLSEFAKLRRSRKPRPGSIAAYFAGTPGITVKEI